MSSEGLKPYFFDIFKQCYAFYPKVEISKEKIRITSKFNNKEIKVVESINILPIRVMLPIAVSKWKKKFLAKFKHINEDDVENVIDFSERLVEVHNVIRKQLTDDKGKLKYFDIPVILKTVQSLIKSSFDSLRYLTYTVSDTKITFSNFMTLETEIEYTIGSQHETTKIQVII